MEARPRAARIWGGWLAAVAPGLLLAAGLFAYRPLLLGTLRTSPTGSDVQHWLFRPEQLPAALVLGTAAWLLWMRRGRLASLPARSARSVAVAGAALGAAFFVWALLTRAADLLLVSLAAHLLAFAAAAKGGGGARAVLLPALVLLLGLRIPEPLLDELVWHLQLWTAAESAWLLELLGHEVERAGVILELGERTFHVIDACSGLRGIQILTIAALIVRELFASAGARQWLGVLLAPLLGHALNAVRIAAVALSPNPEALVGPGADHTPQGVAVLAAGTGVLYALAWGMAGVGPRRASGPPADAPRPARSAPWWPAASWLLVLAGLSVAVAPFSAAGTRGATPKIELPESGSGWTSESLEPDPLFVGYVPEGNRLFRRYERAHSSGEPRIVELFVGVERPELPISSSRLLSSKLVRPGPEWSIERSRRTRVWLLGEDADLAVVSRPGPHYALVYRWRLRDEGLWRETLRSLLALEKTPFRRERPRAVVRLATPLAKDQPVAHDWAKKTLDQFIADFRDALAGL